MMEKMLFLFNTQMMNQAAESVKTGRCPNIISYHKSLDESKRVLAKLPPKFSSPAKPCHSSFSMSEPPGNLENAHLAANNPNMANSMPPQIDKFPRSATSTPVNIATSNSTNNNVNNLVKLEMSNNQQQPMSNCNNGGYPGSNLGVVMGQVGGGPAVSIKRELSNEMKPLGMYDPSNLPIITDGAGNLSGGDPLEKMARLTQEALPFEPPLKQPKLEFSSVESKNCSISSTNSNNNSNNVGPNGKNGGNGAKLSDDLLTPSQRQHREEGIQKIKAYENVFLSKQQLQPPQMATRPMQYLPPGMVPAPLMTPDAMKYMDPSMQQQPPIGVPQVPSVPMEMQMQQQKWLKQEPQDLGQMEKSVGPPNKMPVPPAIGSSGGPPALTPNGSGPCTPGSGQTGMRPGNVPTMMVAGKPAVMVHPNMNAKSGRGSRAQQQSQNSTSSAGASGSEKYFSTLSSGGPPPPNVTFVDPGCGFDPYGNPVGPGVHPHHHHHPMGAHQFQQRPCFFVQQPIRSCPPPPGATVVYGPGPIRAGPMSNGPPPSNVNVNMNIQINAPPGDMGHPMHQGPQQQQLSQCYQPEFMQAPLEDDDIYGQYDQMYAPGPPNVNIALAGLCPGPGGPPPPNAAYFCGPGGSIVVEQDPSAGPPSLAVQMHTGGPNGSRITAHAHHGPPAQQQQPTSFMGPVTSFMGPASADGNGGQYMMNTQKGGVPMGPASHPGHSPMVNNTFVNATMSIQQVNIQNVGPFPHGNIVGVQHGQPVPAGTPYVISAGYQHHAAPRPVYRHPMPCGAPRPGMDPNGGGPRFINQQLDFDQKMGPTAPGNTPPMPGKMMGYQSPQFVGPQTGGSGGGPPKIHPEAPGPVNRPAGPGRLMPPDFHQNSGAGPQSPLQPLTFLNPTGASNLTPPNPNYEAEFKDFQQRLYSTPSSRRSSDNTPNFS